MPSTPKTLRQELHNIVWPIFLEGANVEKAVDRLEALYLKREAEALQAMLDVIAKDQAWEQSRDHMAVKFGLPIKFDHSPGNCICNGSIYAQLTAPYNEEEKTS